MEVHFAQLACVRLAFWTLDMAPQATINWAIYNSLPPEEAQYQLAHIDDDKTVGMATAYIVSLTISVLAVIMRFVSRRIGRAKYGADDWIMLVALVNMLFYYPCVPQPYALRS